MKALFKNLLILSLLGLPACLYAQQPVTGDSRLGFIKVESYKVEVTYNKTTHLIFPSAIRYVDLGSEYLIAGKAEDADNVLRVKAAVQGFPAETNFSVITDEGGFYNFDVCYNAQPATMSYTLSKMQKSTEKSKPTGVLLEELGGDSPEKAHELMENIYNKNKRAINHIGSRSYGILFLLKGIYVQDGKLFFHTELRNQTNLPFAVDFIKFKIVDKKLTRRTVIQEMLLKPLRIYRPIEEIGGKAAVSNVFLLDQFTMTSDKVLSIEIFEKNGGRHQFLRVENADLVRAGLIKNKD